MRADGDNWDITTSVGATALMVAAGRAYASEDEDPLIVDPYARFFVESATMQEFDFRDPTTWPEKLAGMLDWMKVHMAVRTKVIDDAIIAAVDRGVRQLVILASGLDTRPYRLAQLSECKTFEVDREQVLVFKEGVLEKNQAKAIGDHKSIAADLRDAWIYSLFAEGFEPDKPTIWVTEGLLPYLPAQAQWNLAHTIENNSALGSRWILDVSDSELMQEFKNMPATGYGNINDLFYDENIPSSAEFVASWNVSKELLGANLEKFHQISPAIPPALAQDNPDGEKSILAIIEDTGFYIADKN